MPYSDWMADHQHKRLGDMHLPGAHDAGTIRDKIDLTALGTVGNAVTQDLSMRDQLRCGTRFFDLRLKVKNDEVVAHHTTGGQGAYGVKRFDQTIQEIDRWCGRHPTEVVIIRISHTSTDTNTARIVRSSCARNGNRGGKLHTGTGNLCTKTLREITAAGGGLVCILEESAFGAQIDQAQGIHAYSKYKSTGANDRGIATCGIYTKTHKLAKVVRNGLQGSYDHNTKHDPGNKDHLWQIYWQKTYLNPASTTGITRGTKKDAVIRGGTVHGGTHAATNHMIHLMQGHRLNVPNAEDEDYTVGKQGRRKVQWSTLDARNFMLPNIISYDFVNEATNAEIIQLNARQRLAHLDEDESEMESA